MLKSREENESMKKLVSLILALAMVLVRGFLRVCG